jgi:hypothetical protein
VPLNHADVTVRLPHAVTKGKCGARSGLLDQKRVSVVASPRLRSRQLDRLNDRGIVVLRLVDPGRDRPHPHRLGWERLHQVTRIILVAQPADVIIANVRTAKQPYAIAMMDGCGGPFDRDAAVWLAVIQTTMAILAVVIASRLYQWLGTWAK